MKTTSIITLSILTAVALQAAPIPNIGDALKQVQPPKLKQEKKEIPQIKSEKLKEPTDLEDGQKVFVKEIVLSGAVHISDEILNTIVAPYENKELSFNEMQELTTSITKLYREKGYFVARAYIPAQNILAQKGNLKINIIEGSYGKFMLENNSLVKNSILQANLDDIKDKNIVSTHTLERAMLIISDTPGVEITKADIRPGEEVGSSDFIIATEATKKYNGYIIADNYGSQYTGKHRVMAGIEINSPFKIGDKLSFSGLISEEEALLNGRVAYDFPLHANGLRGEVSYARTTYELGSTFKDFNYQGSSDSFAFKATYPLIKSRLENLDLYTVVSYDDMEDEIKSTQTETKKNSYVLTVGTNYTKDFVILNKNSQSKVNLSFTTGQLNFDNKADEITDENGANTNGTFNKANLELGQDFELTPTIRWENSFQAQYALGDKNLDGSQDLSIGGIYGVKYYPDGEESAENGYIYNTELFYTLPSLKGLNTTLSIFYDVGRVYMSKNITNEEPKTLQSFGIGYYGSYKNIFINAHLAHNISHDVTSQDDYSNRVLAQVGWVF